MKRACRHWLPADGAGDALTADLGVRIRHLVWNPVVDLTADHRGCLGNPCHLDGDLHQNKACLGR